MTTGTKTMMMIAVAACGLLAGAPPAPAQEELRMNYRCENAKMEADAGELRCMDRCQRKADKQSDRVRDQFFAVCADDCHQRCEEKKKRLDASPKCAGQSVAADPRRCAAKHLGGLAQLNLCLASCAYAPPTGDESAAEASPEEVACQQKCDERYTAARDRLDASDACALGGAPVCVYQ